MKPRLVAQLGALFLAESQSISEDPDGKLKKKDGWSEHRRDDLQRPLTPGEQAEADQLEGIATRLFVDARSRGLACLCEEHVFGDPRKCYRLRG